jgi:hypothetical protein
MSMMGELEAFVQGDSEGENGVLVGEVGGGRQEGDALIGGDGRTRRSIVGEAQRELQGCRGRGRGGGCGGRWLLGEDGVEVGGRSQVGEVEAIS